MGFVERVLNKIFPKKQTEEQEHRIIVSESLERSSEFSTAYSYWNENKAYQNYTAELMQKYRSKLLGIYNKNDFFIFESHASLGFYFTCEEHIATQEYRFLLEHFKDRTLLQGYRSANTQRRITEKGDNVETIERYYLKPPIPKEVSKSIDQLYGNVLMEFVLINDKASYVKVMIHAYVDQHFEPAKKANDLVTALFSAD